MILNWFLLHTFAHNPLVFAQGVPSMVTTSLGRVVAEDLSGISGDKIRLRMGSQQAAGLSEDINEFSRLQPLGSGTPLHQEIFGFDISGVNYLKWLESGIKTIRYDRDRFFSPVTSTASQSPAAIRSAYVKKQASLGQPYTWFGRYKEMAWITPAYFEGRSLFTRISLLVHERRHLETRDRHVECSLLQSGRIYGTGRFCDEAADGSYGTEAVFIGNIVLFMGDKLSDAELWEALFYINDRLSRIIDPSKRALVEQDIHWPELKSRAPRPGAVFESTTVIPIEKLDGPE